MTTSTLLSLAGTILLFFGVTFGLAWPVVARFSLGAAEKIVASVALSLLGVFLFSWGVYIFALPRETLWFLPVFAATGLLLTVRSFAAALNLVEVRSLVLGQLLVTAWCAGGLSLIVSYSGGGWAADWFEHWERAQFFLQQWPENFLFLGRYPLPARPPLANVVTGAFLQCSRVDFAHYQLVSTLLGSLVFLPAALLARRFGGNRAVPVLAVLLMLNPLVVQNATFAWTKLPAAFFALTALYFFLRAQDADAPAAGPAFFAATLAAGLLAHYSIGPYAVVLAVAWIVFSWKFRSQKNRLFATGHAVLAGAAVLVLWFGWTLATYGPGGTFLSNSSITALDQSPGGQIGKILLNIRDTVVPHFFRSFDKSLIAQNSPWGSWRDGWFQLYQLNLFFSFGSVAWAGLLVISVRATKATTSPQRGFWWGFVGGVVVLGIGVHAARDLWGLAHICLQPLVIVGLAFLASRWSTLSRLWRFVLAAGAIWDFAAGIALHFAAQNHALDRWFGPPNTPLDYSSSALMNLAGKLQNGVTFLGDLTMPLFPVILVFLAAVIAAALRRAARAEAEPHQPNLR